MTPTPGKLTSVHDALQSAILAHKGDGPTEVCSYRLEPNTKLMAEDICARHGITLASFVSWAVRGLVKDYNQPELDS